MVSNASEGFPASLARFCTAMSIRSLTLSVGKYFMAWMACICVLMALGLNIFIWLSFTPMVPKYLLNTCSTILYSSGVKSLSSVLSSGAIIAWAANACDSGLSMLSFSSSPTTTSQPSKACCMPGILSIIAAGAK